MAVRLPGIAVLGLAVGDENLPVDHFPAGQPLSRRLRRMVFHKEQPHQPPLPFRG